MKAKKVAGQRNESCAGLLFPPEQGVNCTHFGQISSGIFLESQFVWPCAACAQKLQLARADGVDFEEVGAEWRRGRDAADYQDLIAFLCELAGQDRGFCLLD